MSPSTLFAELKRRNVLRAAVLYLGGTWALAQGIAQLTPVVGAPESTARWFLIAAAIGFPFWVVFSWVYEFTPQGLKRESDVVPGGAAVHSSGRRLDKWIIAVLAIAVVLLLTNMLVGRKDAASGTSKPVAAKSIAVLPFDDLSPAHDHGYFSDGMAEELLNALARIQDLKVAGRASSFYYGKHDSDVRSIGKALDVANLLQGSVRTQNDAVRISVQLIRTSDGFEIWSQSYDGDMRNIFDVQERIARAIAAHLQVVLAASGTSRLVPVATTSSEAYEKFVVAQSLVNKRVNDSLPRAISLLREATALDPNFARAWAKLAVAYAVLAQYVPGDWNANWRVSDEAARKAVAIDPGEAEAYAALSYNQFSQRHYTAMVEPMRRALALAPGNSAVNYWAANELAATGRTREAEARIDAVLGNDPANVLLLFYKSMMRWRMGDEAGALEYVHRGDAPNTAFGALMFSLYDAAHGRVQESAEQFARSTGKMGTALSTAELRTVYRGTYDSSALPAAMAIMDAHRDDEWVPTLLVYLAQPKRSFDLFEHGPSRLSDAYLNWLWQPEPWSRKARTDPAFQGFAKRLGLVDYWKANRWPDLCTPTPQKGEDAFTCR